MKRGIMGPLVLEDHRSLFRNDDAFKQFLGALEAKVSKHGFTPIWGNDRLIGTAIDAATAKLMMQESVLRTIASDPKIMDDIEDRILNDAIVE